MTRTPRTNLLLGAALLTVAALLLWAPGPRASAEGPSATSATVPVPGSSGTLPVPAGTTTSALFEGLRQEACEPGLLAIRGVEGWAVHLRDAPAFVNVGFPTNVVEDSTLFVYCLAEWDVAVPHGDFVLAGTLSLPPLRPPYPATILVSGSGPQDRDEAIPELPGYEPFRWVAEHLVPQGIAVLRYDDRGVAQSTGEFAGATSGDFADDAEVVFEFLRRQPGIDPARVGITGHSEGGMIAAMIAARNADVAFVVSLAGPGLDFMSLLDLQSQLILESLDLPPEVREQQLALGRQVREYTRDGEWEVLEEALRAIIAEQLAALPPELQDTIDFETILEAEMLQSMTWMHFILNYDIAADWANVTVPVLGLFGALDIQVPAEENREPMEAALADAGNDDVTVIVFPTANHLFQEAVTGSPEEYPHLPMRFVPGLLDTLTDWLLERVGTAR